MKPVEPQNVVSLVCEGRTSRQVARVDAERLEELSAFAWRVLPKGRRRFIVVRWDGRIVPLAADVYGPIPDGYSIAHRDRDEMNYQRSNLVLIMKGRWHQKKLMTRCRNWCGHRVEVKSTSWFRGVSAYKGKWRAAGRLNGKKVHLGEFPGTREGEIAAARAHDRFLREHFGDFALFNFPS